MSCQERGDCQFCWVKAEYLKKISKIATSGGEAYESFKKYFLAHVEKIHSYLKY